MKCLPYVAVLICLAGCESKPAVEQKTANSQPSAELDSKAAKTMEIAPPIKVVSEEQLPKCIDKRISIVGNSINGKPGIGVVTNWMSVLESVRMEDKQPWPPGFSENTIEVVGTLRKQQPYFVPEFPSVTNVQPAHRPGRNEGAFYLTDYTWRIVEPKKQSTDNSKTK